MWRDVIKRRRPTVGIIGAGIFGLSCALELAGELDVVVFDQNPDILAGATFANHNRHHYGYHYPRSKDTARQCLSSRQAFEELYGAALEWDFETYYAIANDGSKTGPAEYLRFCDEMGLPYEETWPTAGTLEPAKIALCLKVREAVYDTSRLRGLVRDRLRAHPEIHVLLEHRVEGGRIADDRSKVLEVLHRGTRVTFEVDFLVNASYARYNQVCAWLGVPGRAFQFNLQELDVVRLPAGRRIGVCVQDGAFPSILPYAGTGEHLLAHVELSQLRRDVSSEPHALLGRAAWFESNWEDIRRAGAEYIPLLDQAEYVRSIFVDRVVDPSRAADDARLSGITAHGAGCWSIFSAKVITSVTTARALAPMILAEL